MAKIGTHEVTLLPISPLAALALWRTPEQQAAEDVGCFYARAAAALALAWPPDRTWPAPVRPRPWRPGVKILDYGQEVFDDLIRAKCSLDDVVEASTEALRSIGQSLITEQEVSAVEDFSEAPSGG